MLEIPQNNILAAKIAAVREIYSLIDKKTTSFVDAETELENALAKKSEYENRYNIKEMLFYTLIGTIALLIPMSFLSMFFSAPLYYFTPIVALAIVLYLKNDYKKKNGGKYRNERTCNEIYW